MTTERPVEELIGWVIDSIAATITDQLPFATFTPGWTAAIIVDAKPTTERCPACWGVDPGGICDCCNGFRTCPPVPWTGNDLEE